MGLHWGKGTSLNDTSLKSAEMFPIPPLSSCECLDIILFTRVTKMSFRAMQSIAGGRSHKPETGISGLLSQHHVLVRRGVVFNRCLASQNPDMKRDNQN